MTNYVQELRTLLSSLAQADKAPAMEAYMRNQFHFYGIPAPERRLILREFIKEFGLPQRPNFDVIMHELWLADQRELQYAAMELCYRSRRKAVAADTILFEFFVCTRSWWDTVDFVAARLVGPHFQRFPEQREATIPRWIGASNMWLNRTAIIFQLGYKGDTDTELLREAIMPHIASKEFFLQKAIGWALRQYSYTDAEWVRSFVASHDLKPLSVREALKAVHRTEKRS